MYSLFRYLLFMHLFSVISENIAISHTFLKTRFFGLHFCGRQYGCIFNHFDITGPESYQIWRNNSKKRPLRRLRLLKVIDFGTNRKPICDLLFVIKAILDPTLHRLKVIVDYWSNLCVQQGVSLFKTHVWDKPLNSGPQNLASKN